MGIAEKNGGVFLRFLILVVYLDLSVGPASAQGVLKNLEPGIGYSQFKQWAIENKLVFESFTKDSMVVRDSGLKQWESVRIQARFCGGDDYAGKASSLTIQQRFDAGRSGNHSTTVSELDELITLERDYVEFLSGKADADGKFALPFGIRRDRNDGSGLGIAFSQEGKAGFWEVGLFRKDEMFLLQTVRRKENICQ